MTWEMTTGKMMMIKRSLIILMTGISMVAFRET